MTAGLHRTCDVDPYERSIACAQQKAVVDELGEDGTAKRGFECPESPCLRFGEPQTRHLQEFPPNATDDVFVKTNA
jgi:hypothetical protein